MNDDNMSAAGGWPVNAIEEPVVFMTRSNLKPCWWNKTKRHRRPWFIQISNLHILPKLQVVGYVTPQFQIFDGRRGNTPEHIIRFFDSTGAHTKDQNLCLRKFSKSLTDHTYTWYVNLKPGSVHEWEHLVSLFITKLLCFTFLKIFYEKNKAGEITFHEEAININNLLF